MPVARLGDDALRDRVVECERAVAMLQAIQADAMVQMGVRARAADQAEVVAGGEPMWSQQCRETYVPDEIGVLLGWTKMAAVARYDTACRVAGLPVVAAAWRAGRVDARKVAVIVEQVAPASGPGHRRSRSPPMPSVTPPSPAGPGPRRSCGSGCAGR